MNPATQSRTQQAQNQTQQQPQKTAGNESERLMMQSYRTMNPNFTGSNIPINIVDKTTGVASSVAKAVPTFTSNVRQNGHFGTGLFKPRTWVDTASTLKNNTLEHQSLFNPNNSIVTMAADAKANLANTWRGTLDKARDAGVPLSNGNAPSLKGMTDDQFNNEFLSKFGKRKGKLSDSVSSGLNEIRTNNNQLPYSPNAAKTYNKGYATPKLKNGKLVPNKPEVQLKTSAAGDIAKGAVKGASKAALVAGLINGGIKYAQTKDVGEAAKGAVSGAGIGAGMYAGGKAVEKLAGKALKEGLKKGGTSVAGKVATGASKALLGKKAFTEVAGKGAAKIAGKAAGKVVPVIGGATSAVLSTKDLIADLRRGNAEYKGKKLGVTGARTARTILNAVSAAAGVVSCIPIAGQVVGGLVDLGASGLNVLGQSMNWWSSDNEEIKDADMHTQI